MVFTAQQALAGAERDLPRSLARCWLDQDESILPFSRTKTFWQMKKGMEEIWGRTGRRGAGHVRQRAQGRPGAGVPSTPKRPLLCQDRLHARCSRPQGNPPTPTPQVARCPPHSADRAACAARTGASASGGPTSPEAARARAPRPRTPAAPRAARGAGRRRRRFSSRAQPPACT